TPLEPTDLGPRAAAGQEITVHLTAQDQNEVWLLPAFERAAGKGDFFLLRGLLLRCAQEPGQPGAGDCTDEDEKKRGDLKRQSATAADLWRLRGTGRWPRGSLSVQGKNLRRMNLGGVIVPRQADAFREHLGSGWWMVGGCWCMVEGRASQCPSPSTIHHPP